MSNNAFWAYTNICIAAVLIVLMISMYLTNTEATKARLEEHKAATSAGLQQQLIGHEKIWVKIDKDK